MKMNLCEIKRNIEKLERAEVAEVVEYGMLTLEKQDGEYHVQRVAGQPESDSQLLQHNNQPLQISDLKAGEHVRFIGSLEEFNENVTTGKSYEVLEMNYWAGDLESVSFMDDRGSEYNRSVFYQSNSHLFEKVIEEPTTKRTNNEQRAETIQQAKRLVEGFKDVQGNYSTPFGVCKAEFIVNSKNRMVTVLMRSIVTGKLKTKGVAKCRPGEVFNADIGEAIALARAGLFGIQQEFMQAVQPNQVAVGMEVHYGGRVQEVLSGDEKWKSVGVLKRMDMAGLNCVVIEDTNAQYKITPCSNRTSSQTINKTLNTNIPQTAEILNTDDQQSEAVRHIQETSSLFIRLYAKHRDYFLKEYEPHHQIMLNFFAAINTSDLEVAFQLPNNIFKGLIERELKKRKSRRVQLKTHGRLYRREGL